MHEVFNDANECFDANDDHCAIQQLIRHTDLFRGFIVKEWVMASRNNMNFRACDKVIKKVMLISIMNVGKENLWCCAT